MKIMFSIHVGDSIAHVLRTRGVAKKFFDDGHDVLYVVPKKVHNYLNGYLPTELIVDNSQSYGFSRLENINKLSENFCKRATVEYYIYKSFRPDYVIGDMGLVASSYCIETPLIKILNRFPLELYFGENTALVKHQRKIIISQIENIINNTRASLNINKIFKYSDFILSPIICNGDEKFIGYKLPNMNIVGLRSGISFSNNYKPRNSTVFVSLGTGDAPSKSNLVQQLLKIISPIFDKIYLNIGIGMRSSTINIPKHVIVKSLFKEFPWDVGCLICHGGYGIVHVGLLRKIPTFVFPFHVEHLCNAHRLSSLGGGTNLGNLSCEKFSGLTHRIEYDFNKFNESLAFRNGQDVQNVEVKLCTDEEIYTSIREMITNYNSYTL